MTPKQERFVQEYLVDLNATQAAIRAGYSAKTAEAQGSRLLRNVEVSAAIEAGRGEQAERTQITADWILERLREVVERSMQAEAVVDRQGKPVMVETPTGEFVPAYVFNSAGANKALELLGKHQGMFIDRQRHEGPGGGAVKFILEG